MNPSFSAYRLSAIIIALGALATGAAQTELPPELARLSRIKQQMAQNLSRLPNYTCLETIERSEQLAPLRPFQRIDLLRLEVTQVGKTELYAWPGARRFEEKHLSELVEGGTIGTGDFALHARSVFQGSAPAFRSDGEEELDGRATLRYGYRISRLSSGYRINAAGKQAVVPFHGSFWVDAKSLELIRLDVQADEIPAELDISSAITQIHYAKTRIGPSEFLLPQSAEMLLTRPSGTASRNHIEFAHCRQYLTESVVSFEPAAADRAPVAAARITETELPSGLSLAVALETLIDSEQSAVGDFVRARVRKEVKHHGKVIVPQGAIVTGRIRKLGNYFSRSSYFMVGLQFSEVEFENTRARFLAQLQEIEPFPGLVRQLSLPAGRRSGSLALPAIVSTQSGVGTFLIEAKRFRLPDGLQMVWKTKNPGSGNQP